MTTPKEPEEIAEGILKFYYKPEDRCYVFLKEAIANAIRSERQQARGKELSSDYHAGKGCKCAAHSQEECGCPDVDWTPREVYELRAENQRLRKFAEFVLDSYCWEDGAEPDGADLQDKAEELKLIELRPVNPDENDYGESELFFPVWWPKTEKGG